MTDGGETFDLATLLSDCADRQRRWARFDGNEASGNERATFIRDNVLALQVEIAELLQTVRWKPWAWEGDRGTLRVDRDVMLDEVADVFFFLGNLLVGLDVSAGEIAAAVATKRAVIEDRHDKGATRVKKPETAERPIEPILVDGAFLAPCDICGEKVDVTKGGLIPDGGRLPTSGGHVQKLVPRHNDCEAS